MRPQFNDGEYTAGFEHMRRAMVDGLGKVAGDRHAGSFVIGAFCAVVRLAWEGRDPGMTRIQIAAVLATVAADVLRDAEDPGALPLDPALAMLESFHQVAIACSPRDDQGRALVDGGAVLDALANHAAQTLISIPDAAERAVQAEQFRSLVAHLVRELGQAFDQLGRFAPSVPQGGRA